ncbi:MAG: ATP synthase subunit I [Elainellaceae cyanobacterium]
MMRLSVWSLVFPLTVGLMLGSVYFGGLWMTLTRLPQWRRPFLLIGLSLMVRLTILLGGGAWLLRFAAASPLLAILLLSAGVWLSRMALIARLLATLEPASVRAAVHPEVVHPEAVHLLRGDRP